MKRLTNSFRCGFTLVEVMTAIGSGSIIMAALLTASVALQRSFAAVEDYSLAQGDQLRVQDYIAMDCRRASGVSVSGSTLTLTLASFFDGSGNAQAPNYDSNGAIQYGSGGTVQISYYKSGNYFMRQVGASSTVCATGATWNNCAKVIARDVSDFTATITDTSTTTGTVKCGITFSPRFRLTNPNITATTVYSETFLRNAKARP